MGDIVLQRRDIYERAGFMTRGAHRRFHPRPDFGEFGLGDRKIAQDDFEPIIPGRVMRCRYHHANRHAQLTSSKMENGCGYGTQIQNAFAACD